MLVGNGMRVIRSFDGGFIEYKGKSIVDNLKDLVREEKPDLNEVKNIIDFIQEKQSIVGIRQSSMEGVRRYNESIRGDSIKNFQKESKLEEVIMEMEDLSLNYEALSKAIAKISSLSLVNYI